MDSVHHYSRIQYSRVDYYTVGYSTPQNYNYYSQGGQLLPIKVSICTSNWDMDSVHHYCSIQYSRVDYYIVGYSILQNYNYYSQEAATVYKSVNLHLKLGHGLNTSLH